MGLEKPVLAGSIVNEPFNFAEVGKVSTASSFTFNGYGVTSVEPLSLTVDFTAKKDKFYLVKGDNFVALGGTKEADSTNVYFHVKNIASSQQINFGGMTVYECEV